MANKTYLQLVNYVLTQLRETTVPTVSYSAYSNLIGQWVNDAKEMVEDAWDWQCLDATSSFSLIPGQLEYNMSAVTTTNLYEFNGTSFVAVNFNERARLRIDVENPYRPMAFDITTGQPMQLIHYPYDLIVRTRVIQPTPLVQTQPMFFGLKRQDQTIGVNLFETPTVSRNWIFWWTLPQIELAGDSDTMLIPWRPVTAMVIDRAMNERGEEIGEPGTTLAQRAQVHIDNAIGSDSREQPHLTTFFPG